MCQMFSACFHSLNEKKTLLLLTKSEGIWWQHTQKVTSSFHHIGTTCLLIFNIESEFSSVNTMSSQQLIDKVTDPYLNALQNRLTLLIHKQAADQHTAHLHTPTLERTAADTFHASLYRHESVRDLPDLFCHCFSIWDKADGWGGVKQAVRFKERAHTYISIKNLHTANVIFIYKLIHVFNWTYFKWRYVYGFVQIITLH